MYGVIIKEHETTHTIIDTLKSFNIFKSIRKDNFELIWEELKLEEDSTNQERAAIKYYIKKYKEPPPFNLNIAREKIAELKIKPDEFVKSVLD